MAFYWILITNLLRWVVYNEAQRERILFRWGRTISILNRNGIVICFIIYFLKLTPACMEFTFYNKILLNDVTAADDFQLLHQGNLISNDPSLWLNFVKYWNLYLPLYLLGALIEWIMIYLITIWYIVNYLMSLPLNVVNFM